ncbi:GDP-mannose 4,6-dehydratase [Candidatus Micrarchaeota archaeon]|nr:GDP-mannose 4,6-dehydratase [Candidatus Micrarchaeota archaeon]MBU2476471.1 GDP-mannose 4,6-dehydratase [Candidatus Micrarchaeota archaeon]
MKAITGGAGFIGTNLAEFFLSKGEKVLILDDFSKKGSKENKKYLEKKFHENLKIIKCDIRSDKKIMEKTFSEAEAVFHLAGQVAVTNSVKNPRQDFEINALGAFNVLEAVRKSKENPVLIYSSTNKVYGKMDDLKITEKNNKYFYEETPEGIKEERLLDFHSPYGCSKGTGDQYFRDYARIYGLNSVVFRQSCVYGKRQFGTEDQGWIAWFVIASVFGKKITIFGNGKQSRDVLYSDDVVNAFDLAAKKIKKTKGKIFNIGGGPENTLSLLELIELLEELNRKKITYSFDKWRPGDQKVFVSNIEKAEKEFGWKPKVPAKKGVEILFNWVKENKKEIQTLKLF